MNKIINLLLIFFLLLITGCTQKSVIRNDISGVYTKAPEWVLASEFASGVCGTGMALIDDDYDEAMVQAEENARAELYSSLNKKIRACMFELFKKNTALENEAFARIGDSVDAVASEHFRTAESWRSPNNEIFVLVVSDVDVIRDAFKNNLTDFLKARKPENYDPDNPKIQEDIDKLSKKHFRNFRKL